MSIDKNRKNEIQQKIIETLTKEVETLKETLDYERSLAVKKNQKYETVMNEFLEAQRDYQNCILEIKEKEKKFDAFFEMYANLIT